MKERIVLAYSGGPDTTAAIPWLAERYAAEIVTVTLDLGQGRELEEIRDRALASGAVRAHVLDVREEFAREYILPALQAGALYEGRYPMATALGRPLIAKKLVEIAGIEQATTIAHGCTGNDQVRIDLTARALNPDIRIVVPAVRATAAPPFIIDTNLWGRSIAGRPLQDSWAEPAEEIYSLTKAPSDAPNTPAYVEIAFERGVPVAVNGVPMALTELVESLSIIGGQHSVGRIDMVENQVAGIKSREVYEAPAAVVLHMAHKELETLVSPKELERLTREVGVTYADLVYHGLWFTPMREALEAFNAKVQEKVTGVVRVKLFKGSFTVVGRKSPNAPSVEIATRHADPETRNDIPSSEFEARRS